MKLGQVYNLKSVEAFTDSAKQTGFTDSFAGSVLARQLTHVNPKIFEKKFPELSFVNSGVSVDNTGGYARRIQSLRVQELGGFTTAGDATSDKGKISLAGEDSYLKVIVREAHSIWEEDEVKEAELQNINLPSRFIQGHNRIYMREIDQAGLVGLEGGTGLLNYAGFASGSAAGTADALTAEQLYGEIAELINAQKSAVSNTPEYVAKVVMMPTRVLNIAQTKILNTAAGSSSVLKALQDNFPDVQFIGSSRAESVGGNSITAAYSNTEDAMTMRIPVPLTIGEIVKMNSFDHRVDSKYRIAGLDVLEDTAGRILTGL